MEYGLKIKNIKAGSLYEYNLGVRESYSYKNAMFTNSLFLDYLLDNGLKIWKEKSTRDIICIDFDWGSRSYKEERKHLRSLTKDTRHEIIKLQNQGKDNKKKIEQLKNKRYKLIKLYIEAKHNQDKYIKKSAEQIRDEFYINGVDVEYITKNKQGEIKKQEIIHYKMLYRSTGKAKKGSCMFIRDKLYKKAKNFLNMGIKTPKKNAPIVEMSAYSPLVSSTIVDRIKINPKNILILKDVESLFITNVVSVELDSDKHCVARKIDNYELKNILFDGQAIIDSSIFPKWGDGYILLRHHFCKMASFCGHIQKFFKDYFGEDYNNAKVVDMWGNEHYAKDIELITTDNAMKWIKFDVSYGYWCDRVYENNCMFGIVKTAHKSKLGDMQKMSYQMVNALDLDIMENVVKNSKEYIELLKSNDDVFLDYLKQNANFSNDYEVLVALCEQNKDFTRSEYFRTRKAIIIQTYTLNFRSGKIIQDGDNLVIVGSPYAMLLHSVDEDVEKDDTFQQEEGSIQCFTNRFNNDEYLASFRSPFNSKNNMGCLHNVYSDNILKYFELGEQIIAVNMQHTDFQDHNNGSDQDSDSLYVTNQQHIVEYAKHCYINYPTIVNNIPKDKKCYDNDLNNYSLIDNNLASAQLAIGESSNLAQLALTYSCNFKDDKYIDYVCILSVLAQVAIDNAKRKFDIDLTKEIKRIKNDMNIKENGYPLFWLNIRKGFNKNRINYKLKCPMNYLSELKFNEYKPKQSTLLMGHFFQKFELEQNRRRSKKVEELIEKYSFNLFNYNVDDSDEDYILVRSDFDDLIKDIQQTYISQNYLGLMSWLVDRAFLVSTQSKQGMSWNQSKTDINKSILLKTLYSINSKSLLKILSKNA